jgi:hypothetical protein
LFKKPDWIAAGHALVGAQIILIALILFSVFGPFSFTQADFVSSYAAGHFADSGHAASAYDPTAQRDFQETLNGGSIVASQVFFYPPIHLLLVGALATLPYPVAYALWVIATVALLLAALRLICGGWGLSLALLSFPVFWITASLGQNAFFTSALFGFGTALLKKNPALAGISLSLLCYKPQLAFLVPLALLAGRYWRSLLFFCLSVFTLAAAATAVFGMGIWQTYLAGIPVAQSIYLSGELGFWSQISVYSALRLIGVGAASATVWQSATMIAAAAIVAFVWSRPSAPFPIKSATLIACAVLAVPVSLSYDLMPLCIAVAWLVSSEHKANHLRPYLIAAVWFCAGAGLFIGRILAIPIFPLAAIAVLAIVYLSARTVRQPAAAVS